MKTLIVEDDFTNRLLLQGYLAPFGECHVAVNGKEAVEAFLLAKGLGQPYDLICLDLVMPGGNGSVALKEIRAIEESNGILVGDGVKVVITTGLKAKEDIFTAFHEVCDAYIVKPVDRAELLNLLKSFGLI